MIQEAIRSLIESKLNDNTASKKFIVGSYAYLEDEGKEFVYSVKNGYTVIDTNYIPSMMVFTCDYQAIPMQINGDASISLTFLLEAREQADLETDLETLDELVAKVVGNYEVITDGTKAYYSVWNMSALIPAGLTDPINGVRYVQIQTTIYVGFSDTNYFGNQYAYKLNGTSVTPYSSGAGRFNEENLPHALGTYEAKGLNETSSVTFTMTFYINSFLSAIVDTFALDTYNMQTVFQLSETTPTRTVTNFSVLIKKAEYSTDLGEKATVTLTFYKSFVAYSA